MRKNTKIGLISAVLILICINIALSMFYTPRKQVLIGDAINLTYSLQSQVEKKLLNHEPIESGFFETKGVIEDVSSIYLSASGDLIFMVDKDTLIWLHPTMTDGKVVWSCERAPKKYTNPSCDDEAHVF